MAASTRHHADKELIDLFLAILLLAEPEPLATRMQAEAGNCPDVAIAQVGYVSERNSTWSAASVDATPHIRWIAAAYKAWPDLQGDFLVSGEDRQRYTMFQSMSVVGHWNCDGGLTLWLLK